MQQDEGLVDAFTVAGTADLHRAFGMKILSAMGFTKPCGFFRNLPFLFTAPAAHKQTKGAALDREEINLTAQYKDQKEE